MRFTGQIRIPEIDHPGVPATILVEEDQLEILLEGESLGRWSTVDIEARRLVSAAFQLMLEGEEITFIADDPIAFAYQGVDHLVEAKERIESLGAIKRSRAIRKSRDGVKPSRIVELREAIEENLAAEAVPAPRMPEPAEPVAAAPAPEPVAPPVAGSSPEERRLEEEWRRLEEFRRDLEEKDARRIEAFRIEVSRLESERWELERIESERRRRFEAEMNRLAELMGRLEELAARVTADADLEDIRAGIAEMERARAELSVAEAERIAESERQLAALEAMLDDVIPMITPEPVSTVTTASEPMVEPEPMPVAEPEPIVAGAEPVAVAEPEPMVEPEPVKAESPPVPEPVREPVPLAPVEHEPVAVAEPMPEPDEPEVVDLDRLGEEEPELVGAAARGRGGIFGAVKAAFTRGNRNHVHDLVSAPGGLGIQRKICRECGYVSISAD